MNEFYNFERDAYEQELFSNKINPKFTDIFPDLETFIKVYNSCELPLIEFFGSSNTEPVKTLYYLLYANYGNSTIASSDETRFKYALFDLVLRYGPTWKEKRDIQKAIRSLTLNDLKAGSKAIYNTANNPNIDPTTQSLTELPYINSQNTTNYVKSDIDAYAYKYSLLRDDITTVFINQFKKLFTKYVGGDVPLWYVFKEEK